MPLKRQYHHARLAAKLATPLFAWIKTHEASLVWLLEYLKAAVKAGRHDPMLDAWIYGKTMPKKGLGQCKAGAGTTE